MKQVKALLAAAAVASVAAMAFAQSEPPAPPAPGPEHHGHFYNKISTDIVDIDTSTGDVTFAGLKDKASIEVLSGMVDAGITASFTLEQLEGTLTDGTTAKYLNLGNGDVAGFNLEDWYLEFRPVQKLTIGFHDAIYATGDYLPVADANVEAGNIGSDVVVVFRPIGGLRIGAGLDLDSAFAFKDYEDVQDYPVLNLGVDYVYGSLFAAGAALRNPINTQNLSAGVYVSFMGVKDLTVNLGYAYGDDEGIGGVSGDNLLTLGATYGIGRVGLGFDLATAFTNLYVGGDVDVDIVKGFDAGLTVTADFDFDASTNEIDINPYMNFKYKNNSFGAGVNVDIANGAAVVSFPIYWKYSI